MSSLRQCLRRPLLWCAILFVLIGGVVVDARRNPSNQVGAMLYVRFVRGYQTVCSPHLTNYVRCRYVPTCSEYSVQAVRENGLVMGLRLTVSRITRCRKSVPLGTRDHAPRSSITTPPIKILP